MTRSIVATFLTTFFMVGAAFAQPQISVSPSAVTPGQSVTITVTGTPGRFFAVIGSSVNSGVSYGGVALGVGNDFTIITTGTLNSAGQQVVTFVPPFNGTTLDRFYLQAATSTAANFLPLQVSSAVVVRKADLASGAEGWFLGGSPFVSVDLPGLASFLVWGQAVISNNSPTEYRASCAVAGANVSGSVALGVADVPAGKRVTVPVMAGITTTAATTVTVHCGTLPADITAGVGLSVLRVAVLH